jgi:hypothetical protein
MVQAAVFRLFFIRNPQGPLLRLLPAVEMVGVAVVVVALEIPKLVCLKEKVQRIHSCFPRTLITFQQTAN